MQTRTKLALLQLSGGLFSWIWILGSAAAVYFFVAALAFDGRWSSFFWAVACSAIAKWLTRGFKDSMTRVAYEAELVARGVSKQDAGQAWVRAYSGGPNMLAEFEGSDEAPADLLEAAQTLELCNGTNQVHHSHSTARAQREIAVNAAVRS